MKTMVMVLCILFMFGQAFAYEVTASGSGVSPDDAVQSALRAAVERAAGAYIYTETSVQDSALLSDTILSVSKSLVNRYSVVSSSFHDGLHHATIKADISASDIKPFLVASKLPTIDESLKNYHVVKNRMNRLLQANDILQKFHSKPASAVYDVQFLDYEVLSIGTKSVKLRLNYVVSLNRFYWDEFFSFMNQITEGVPPNDRWVEVINTDYADRYACIGFSNSTTTCDNPVLVDAALSKNVAKHRTARLVVSIGNAWSIKTEPFQFLISEIKPPRKSEEKITPKGLAQSIDVDVDASVIKNMPEIRLALVP